MTIYQMPADSRVWIYQSNRELSSEEILQTEKKGKIFINEWTAHGADLKASFDIIFNRFVVIAVDEKEAIASGCSIDKSVRLMKDLGQKLGIDFFDRMHVVYRNVKNEIESCSYKDFEKRVSQNLINDSAIVFNNMVTTKKAFDNEWEIPARQSWLSRVFS
jgi:hypothetical protein